MNRNIILIIIGAIILCFAGLNNKFPLVTPDSGGYINSGFTREVAFDRPILYGLFLVHASWGKSLWLVIFSQALALSLVLYYYFRYFSSHKHCIAFYLACLFFITFFMLASVTASTIDAGIFAGISILCGGLLLFAENLRKRDFYIIVISLVISLGMDISYLLTLALLTIIYSFSLLFRMNRKVSSTVNVNFKRIAIINILIIFGWLLVSSIHFFSGAGFGVVRDRKIAMLPCFINDGIAKSYLDSNCKGDNSTLCLYKDSLNKLVTPDGRFYKPALSAEEEHAYLETANGIISQPGFGLDYTKQSIKGFFHQIMSVQTGKSLEAKDSTETIKSIFAWYNEDVRECYISRQMQGWQKFKHLNYSQIISFILCFFIFALVVARKINSRHRNLFIYIFLAYIIHALIIAILYGKNNMQSQIAWLFSIPVFLYLSEARFIHNLLQQIKANNPTQQITINDQA